MRKSQYMRDPINGHAVEWKDSVLVDTVTGAVYPSVEIEGRRIPDLRYVETKSNLPVEFHVPEKLPDIAFFLQFFQATKALRSLPKTETGKHYGTKLQPEMVYYIVRILKDTPNARALDLGCGSGGNRLFLENMGVTDVVSVDYWASSAQMLVDVHRLPFDDGSFDIVLTTATVEHFYNPFVAFREMCRVLKPQGSLLASASFWESWHANSCFHMTPQGLYVLCRQSGLELMDLWTGWGFIPSTLSHSLSKKLKKPGYLLQRLFDGVLRMARGKEAVYRHRLRTGGSFGIYARKAGS